MWELYQGDCLEVLQQLKSGSIDCIISDPPYGTTMAEWDKTISFEKLWQHYKRIIKPNGAILLFGVKPFSAALALSNLRMFRYSLVWVKNKATGHLNANKMPLRAHEEILVFYKRSPVYNPQMTEGAEPMHYAKRTQAKIYGAYKSTESRTGATTRYPTDVLRFSVVNSQNKLHSSQKPVELYEYLIKTYTNPGATLLDSFAGSGTLGAACLALGNRRAIMIEKEPAFCEVIQQRLCP